MGTADLAINVHIGRKVRERRRALGIDVASFARAIGVQPELALQYEDGAAQIPAELLLEFSWVLEVQIEYFFDGCALTVAQFEFCDRELPQDHPGHL